MTITDPPAPDSFRVETVLALAYERGLRYRVRERRRRRGSILVLACAIGGAGAVVATKRDNPPIIQTGPASHARLDYASTGAPDAPPTTFRLTPEVDDLPHFPPDAELLADALAVPVDQRQVWAVHGTSEPLWSVPAWSGPAVPLFTDASVAGIYIDHLGLVDRAAYDAPSFDPEIEARARFGTEEYERRRADYWAALREAEN